MAVKWLTKKVKSLFPFNDRNLHLSCKIYKGLCKCGETYIGETTTFRGVFYLLLQKMVQHVKT